MEIQKSAKIFSYTFSLPPCWIHFWGRGDCSILGNHPLDFAVTLAWTVAETIVANVKLARVGQVGTQQTQNGIANKLHANKPKRQKKGNLRTKKFEQKKCFRWHVGCPACTIRDPTMTHNHFSFLFFGTTSNATFKCSTFVMLQKINAHCLCLSQLLWC